MKTKRELFPKVSITTKGHYFVYFWYCNKRYRYANFAKPERQAALADATVLLRTKKGLRNAQPLVLYNKL